MKHQRTKFAFVLFLLISSCLFGQDVASKKWQRTEAQNLKQFKPRHFGLQAARLSLDFQAGLPMPKLKEKYRIVESGTVFYIPALVRVSDDFDRRRFHEYQIQVNTDLGDILSMQIPLKNYAEFIGTSGIEYIELAREIYSKLDQARIASGVNEVHEGRNLSQPYYGKDIVVGIIDFGFDYTHPTFYDSHTGSSRIKRVWEQNTLVGNPPADFTYGRELVEDLAIKEAEKDISLSGHGTHVASVASGSGGSLAEQYRGVAFGSDIVLVSLNYREGVAGNSLGVIDGINYIFQYAESVGKPAVINVSHGHHTGPHDGTSLTDQAIDAMSGPGRIVVGAVGNEGSADGFYLHFDHTFDNENSILSYLVWPDEISAGITLVDIWGEAGIDFQVSLEIFNPHTKMLEIAGPVLHSGSPVSFVQGTLIDLEGDTLYYEGGIEINPLNNRPHAQFYVDNTAQARGNGVNYGNLLDNDFVQFRFQSTGGTVHAYAANNAGEAFFTDLSGIGADEFIEGIRVLGGNPSSTMGELGGTANSIISVGGYTTKNSFVNTAGEMFSFDDVIGDQYFKSSRGPTHDGRIKPDITAPANFLAAAENSFYDAFDESLAVEKIDKGEGENWNFSIRRGTSVAAPIVAGIVALMLEIDPNLTPERAKERLAMYARADNFTGNVPNQIWGYGKVDAAAVMSSLDQPTNTKNNFTSDQLKIFPNPNRGRFTLALESPGPMVIEILDASGRSILKKDISKLEKRVTFDMREFDNGIYFLQQKHKHKTKTSQRKLIIMD